MIEFNPHSPQMQILLAFMVFYWTVGIFSWGYAAYRAWRWQKHFREMCDMAEQTQGKLQDAFQELCKTAVMDSVSKRDGVAEVN